MRKQTVKLCQQLLASHAGINSAHFTAATTNVAARHMSSGPINSKEGKVLHPDLLNDNLKKTQVSNLIVNTSSIPP
jgi:hypothetical protein